MKIFKQEISLNKNARGCYILDTIKGCPSCLKIYKNGCYNECYAKKIADRYKFDFTKLVKRNFTVDNNQLFLFDFKDETHLNYIIKKINNADMPFIRIGEMGDPSEDWEHTIDICKKISISNKKIVIVTKHWNKIPFHLSKHINELDICINTSISAMDTKAEIDYRLEQFYMLKNICNSVLRIVSCDFNKKNDIGYKYYIIQNELFKHKPNIDTIFRCENNNELVKNKIINIEKSYFLKSKVFISKFNENAFFGNCKYCKDMCGIYQNI